MYSDLPRLRGRIVSFGAEYSSSKSFPLRTPHPKKVTKPSTKGSEPATSCIFLYLPSFFSRAPGPNRKKPLLSFPQWTHTEMQFKKVKQKNKTPIGWHLLSASRSTTKRYWREGERGRRGQGEISFSITERGLFRGRGGGGEKARSVTGLPCKASSSVERE
jgi:hypothetical protein